MKRDLYEPEHEEFRKVVKDFVKRDVIGNVERWEEQESIDTATWHAAGDAGILGLAVPEQYGGPGLPDFRYRSVLIEELYDVGAVSLHASFALQDDLLLPYFLLLASEEQKARWLPGIVSGRTLGSVAMTEPSGGSDLRAVRTSAKPVEGGWLLNGSKVFITGGIKADIVVTVARTPTEDGKGRLSLFLVEAGMHGFEKGRQLQKIGLHAQDTAELFYSDVFVPDSNVLGAIGDGFRQLEKNLPLERLSISYSSIASCRTTLAQTLEYTKERHAFGKPIADFQNTRFELAEMSTALDVATAYVDKAILAYATGELTPIEAAKAKWWSTDLELRLVNRCLQLWGGYGYMREYPIARTYENMRIQPIWGGTNEIMKELIGRDLVGRR